MQSIPQRRTATPRKNAATRVRRICAASIASASAAIEAKIIASEGMATRRSAMDAPASWVPPRQCTVPAIPSSAKPEIQTAGLASAIEMYPKPTAAAAAGISTWVSGITARLAGIPMVVAR